MFTYIVSFLCHQLGNISRLNTQSLTRCLLAHHLLITFANRLDPDQARQNVGPDLDPNCLTLKWYSKKNFSKMLILKKISRRQKSMKIFSGGWGGGGKELTDIYLHSFLCPQIGNLSRL